MTLNPVSDTLIAHLRAQLPEDAVKMRYSVRYIPHGSRAFGAVHSSVKQGDVIDSPYYPQVWPTLNPTELRALKYGLDGDVTLKTFLLYRSKQWFHRVTALFPSFQHR